MYSDEIIEQYRNDAQGLASYFGDDYFSRHEKKFPINPFQIMTDLGIHFVFRNFERLEGLFLPASDGENVNIVAINAKRNITRQRFTAAHEICHFIKDVGRNEFVCLMASKDFIEKYADYGGGTRKSNTLVLGTKFETVDWHDIMPELIKLNASVVELEANSESMKNSEIIKKIIEIHHRITVIHPFPDGNGRTSRGFMNVMLIRYGMVPIYIKLANKEIYYAGLSLADKSADFSQLYEFMLKSIIDSHVELAEGFAISV